MTHETAVRVERADGWASIVLDRPHRKNAMTGPMMQQLAAALREISGDDDVAAVVLRGSDGAFSSGVDLTELQRQPPHDWASTFREDLRQAHIALFELPCPIVVALERYAINGSAALAMSADLLIVGETAFLQIGEIRQGAPMPMNAAWLAIKSSEHVATRMALLGDRVRGPELLRLGLAHEVVADGDVRARAEELAMGLASMPAGSARTVKRTIRSKLDIDPETWFVLDSTSTLMTAEQIRS